MIYFLLQRLNLIIRFLTYMVKMKIFYNSVIIAKLLENSILNVVVIKYFIVLQNVRIRIIINIFNKKLIVKNMNITMKNKIIKELNTMIFN